MPFRYQIPRTDHVGRSRRGRVVGKSCPDKAQAYSPGLRSEINGPVGHGLRKTRCWRRSSKFVQTENCRAEESNRTRLPAAAAVAQSHQVRRYRWTFCASARVKNYPVARPSSTSTTPYVVLSLTASSSILSRSPDSRRRYRARADRTRLGPGETIEKGRHIFGVAAVEDYAGKPVPGFFSRPKISEWPRGFLSRKRRRPPRDRRRQNRIGARFGFRTCAQATKSARGSWRFWAAVWKVILPFGVDGD